MEKKLLYATYRADVLPFKVILNESHQSSCHERVLSYLHVTIATLYFYGTVCIHPCGVLNQNVSYWKFFTLQKQFISLDFVWQIKIKTTMLYFSTASFKFPFATPEIKIPQKENYLFCVPVLYLSGDFISDLF